MATAKKRPDRELMAVLELTTRGSRRCTTAKNSGWGITIPARRRRSRPDRQNRLAERKGPGWRTHADAMGLSAGAGFTTAAKAWLPIPPSASKYNADNESKDPDSIFNAYKRLLALRKSEAALRDGVQVSVGDDPDVFAYLRKAGDETVFVLLNMSARERTLSFKPDDFLRAAAAAGSHRSIVLPRPQHRSHRIT